MVLNPFFQQGAKSEQSLVQSLINEQLKMYGVDIYYIPRRYIQKNTIIREVIESQFDAAYPIEAYIDSYEGYGGQGTLLSKFGIQNVDDLTLVISRERYETYITPLIKNIPNITNPKVKIWDLKRLCSKLLKRINTPASLNSFFFNPILFTKS